LPKIQLEFPILSLGTPDHHRVLASGYREYDNERPHSSLGDLTPLEYMSKLIEGSAQQANMEALSGPENGQDPQGLAYQKAGDDKEEATAVYVPGVFCDER
jgi:hypothetical protein